MQPLDELAQAEQILASSSDALLQPTFQALLATLEAMGREERVISLLQRGLQQQPMHASSLFRLAHLAKERREHVLCEEALSRATKHTESAVRLKAHFLLGEYWEAVQEPQRALAAYEAVLAADFTYALAEERAARLRQHARQEAAHETMVQLSQSRLGRFMLRQELGRGAFGTVYLATEQTLGRLVAVKLLHPQHARNQEKRRRFLAEAHMLARVRHTNIVRVFDIDDELCLVVMEYLSGGTLRSHWQRGVSAREVFLSCQSVAETLSVLHAQQIYHGDLKPANLVFRGEGANQLVLTDFGAARERAEGTWGYMSPEQRAGQGATAASDLYALGVICEEGLRAVIDPEKLQDVASLLSALRSETPTARPRAQEAAAYFAALATT